MKRLDHLICTIKKVDKNIVYILNRLNSLEFNSLNSKIIISIQMIQRIKIVKVNIL